MKETIICEHGNNFIACSKCEGHPPDLSVVRQPTNTKDAELTKLRSDVERLRNSVKALILEPHGCPMCDSGKLRNHGKQHWDDCPYLLASNALEETK